MTMHKGLPVDGCRPQSQEAVDLVNCHKADEEKLLRALDDMKGQFAFDQRWLAIARTHFEQAYMALNRSVFQPSRVKLPEDPGDEDDGAGGLTNEVKRTLRADGAE